MKTSYDSFLDRKQMQLGILSVFTLLICHFKPSTLFTPHHFHVQAGDAT